MGETEKRALVVLLVVVVVVSVKAQSELVAQAVALLTPISNSSNLTGSIRFEQYANASEGVRVVVSVRGLEPSARYAIRIHRYGDLRGVFNGDGQLASSVGDVFVPPGSPGLSCPEQTPHPGWVGDWNSSVSGSIDDWRDGFFDLSLTNSNSSIVGLSVVIHALSAAPAGCVVQQNALLTSAVAVGVVGIQSLTNNMASASPHYTDAVCILQQVAPCIGSRCLLGLAGLVLLQQPVNMTNDTQVQTITVIAQVSIPTNTTTPVPSPKTLVPSPAPNPAPSDLNTTVEGNGTSVPVPATPEEAPVPPIAQSVSRGFQVYTWGDLTTDDSDEALGGHYNPDGHMHGLPNSPLRHMGDFGRIQFGANGTGLYHVKLTYPSDQFTVANLLGRAIVVHVDTDHGNDPTCPDSQITGDAGSPLYICVIGVANVNDRGLPTLAEIPEQEPSFANIPCQTQEPGSSGSVATGGPSRRGLAVAIIIMAFVAVFGFVAGLYVGVKCKQENDAYRVQS